MCYDESDWCDLHPVCDDAEDEDWNNKCKHNIKKKAKLLKKKKNTFRCQSPQHNEDTVKAGLSRGVVWIKAVPEDGIPECWNNADEQTNLFLTYVLPGNIQTPSSKSVFLEYLELASQMS